MAVVLRHEQVEVAVVVEITVGGAARDDACWKAGPSARRPPRISSPPRFRKRGPLRVRELGWTAGDVVGDVAVGGEDIEQAVEVVVEEEARERQCQERGLAYRGRSGPRR